MEKLSRKEKRKRAELTINKMVQEIHAVCKQALDEAKSIQELKTNKSVLHYSLVKGAKFAERKAKENPQEAHMWKRALIEHAKYMRIVLEEIKKIRTEGLCEFYPGPNDGPVCACGSDVSGPVVCTKEFSLTCPWAIEERKGGNRWK